LGHIWRLWAQWADIICEEGEGGRPTIPSLYDQKLFMGPKYNAATSLKVEELGFGDFVHHHD